jgi:hypothetical protein
MQVGTPWISGPPKITGSVERPRVRLSAYILFKSDPSKG